MPVRWLPSSFVSVSVYVRLLHHCPRCHVCGLCYSDQFRVDRASWIPRCTVSLPLIMLILIFFRHLMSIFIITVNTHTHTHIHIHAHTYTHTHTHTNTHIYICMQTHLTQQQYEQIRIQRQWSSHCLELPPELGLFVSFCTNQSPMCIGDPLLYVVIRTYVRAH